MDHVIQKLAQVNFASSVKNIYINSICYEQDFQLQRNCLFSISLRVK